MSYLERGIVFACITCYMDRCNERIAVEVDATQSLATFVCWLPLPPESQLSTRTTLSSFTTHLCTNAWTDSLQSRLPFSNWDYWDCRVYMYYVVMQSILHNYVDNYITAINEILSLSVIASVEKSDEAAVIPPFFAWTCLCSWSNGMNHDLYGCSVNVVVWFFDYLW